MYLKFNDENERQKAMLKDSYALNHQVVSVQMVEIKLANIKIVKIHRKRSR